MFCKKAGSVYSGQVMGFNRRISLYWYPLLFILSPLLMPWIFFKYIKFKIREGKIRKINTDRFIKAREIRIPALDSVELSVLVEWEKSAGYQNDAGVSYLFNTKNTSLLFDIGFGDDSTTLRHNSRKMGILSKNKEVLVISHLHPDHMGGFRAMKNNRVTLPREIFRKSYTNCYLPENASVENLKPIVLTEPEMISHEFISTGPLACNLFFFGYTEEQVLIFRIKDKGLFVFTGCGHPGIDNILKMVEQISPHPIYAIGGGFHLPVTNGRGNRFGVQLQRIFGTGKPPWRRINSDDVHAFINAINEVNPQKVFFSAHDTCDASLKYMAEQLNAETHILKAGEKIVF